MNDLLSNHGGGGESTKVEGEGKELCLRSEQASDLSLPPEGR